MSTSSEDSQPDEKINSNDVTDGGVRKRMSFKSMIGSMFSSADEESKKKRLQEANAAREEKKKEMDERKKEMRAKAKELAGTEKTKASTPAAQSPGPSKSLFAQGSKLRRASSNRRLSIQKVQEVDSSSVHRASELIERVTERYEHNDWELDILTSVMKSLLVENPALAKRIVGLMPPVELEKQEVFIPEKESGVAKRTEPKYEIENEGEHELESEPESSEPESSEPESEGGAPDDDNRRRKDERSPTVQFSMQNQIREFHAHTDSPPSSEPESEPESEEGNPQNDGAVWIQSNAAAAATAVTEEGMYAEEATAYDATGAGGGLDEHYADEAVQQEQWRESYFEEGGGSGGEADTSPHPHPPPPPTRRVPTLVSSQEATYASRRASVVTMAAVDEAEASAHAEDIVGLRIMVQGGGDWYEGVVVSFNPEDHLHLIVFGDGAEAVLDLSVEEWRLEETY